MIAATATSPTTGLLANPDPCSKPSPPEKRWRAAALERAYRRRLFDALRAGADGGKASSPRAVKAAADSALALTARGLSRWSRAVLLGRRSGKLLAKAGCCAWHRRPRPAAPTPTGRGRKVKERMRALGRLVPGCRKLPAATMLEEAADYVAALEMQVRAMRAIADTLQRAEGCILEIFCSSTNWCNKRGI